MSLQIIFPTSRLFLYIFFTLATTHPLFLMPGKPKAYEFLENDTTTFKTYTCILDSICRYKTDNAYNMSLHEQAHFTPYKCNLCGKTGTKQIIRNHLKTSHAYADSETNIMLNPPLHKLYEYAKEYSRTGGTPISIPQNILNELKDEKKRRQSIRLIDNDKLYNFVEKFLTQQEKKDHNSIIVQEINNNTTLQLMAISKNVFCTPSICTIPSNSNNNFSEKHIAYDQFIIGNLNDNIPEAKPLFATNDNIANVDLKDMFNRLSEEAEEQQPLGHIYYAFMKQRNNIE